MMSEATSGDAARSLHLSTSEAQTEKNRHRGKPYEVFVKSAGVYKKFMQENP